MKCVGTAWTSRAKEQKLNRICRQIDPQPVRIGVNKLIMECQFQRPDFPCDVSRVAVINAPTIIIIATATNICPFTRPALQMDRVKD